MHSVESPWKRGDSTRFDCQAMDNRDKAILAA